MFRFLSMKHIRSLSCSSSVISSRITRRSCLLCNHVVRKKLDNTDLRMEDQPSFHKRSYSNDLSLMTGVDLAEEIILKNADVELLEELNIQEESELVEETMEEVHPPVIDTLPAKPKKIKGLSKAYREMSAKVKCADLERAGKERHLNVNLCSYIELCVNCGYLNRGLTSLIFYLNKHNDVKVTDINIFNNLMDGFARVGKFDKVMEVWSLMEQAELSPDVTSFAARLEAITLSTKVEKEDLIKSTIACMTKMNITFVDMFNKTIWKRNSREEVLKAIQVVKPRFTPHVFCKELSYSSPLLSDINKPKMQKLKSPAKGLLLPNQWRNLLDEQVTMENNCYINVKSVVSPAEPDDLVLKCRSKLDELTESWGKSILEALDRDLSLMSAMLKSIPQSFKQINIFPYLTVLDKNDYKEILLYEIRKLAEGSETFSPTVNFLYKEIGNQVKLRYDKKMAFEQGIVTKLTNMYDDYIDWYLDPSIGIAKNSRQQWQLVLWKNPTGPSIDTKSNAWPTQILLGVGKFLYKIILRDIKIDANFFRSNQPPQLVPGFYPVYRQDKFIRREEVKPHPILSRLYREASLPHLTFCVSELPMLTPPLPWSSLTSGGYIISKTHLIRLGNQAMQQWERLEASPMPNLYPVIDALNQLASIPWIVNQQVLDVVLEVFKNGGNAKLDIAEHPSSCILPDVPLSVSQDKNDKFLAFRQRMLLKRRKAEMYSLWCDTLYRLSLADHFRDRIFWLPHNMDFRGRVYPCPPHLNHLGGDMARSLLMFAQGKPLGPNGFNWLKMHLVNLTGLKKRSSLDDRLKYADEIMPEILDSASNPLNGQQWWSKSEHPWQTLACCMEIKKALSCPEGVESYVCHFPVHQDGSCNGLQHYAALGRDAAGAFSVNLAPSDVPQDVYSSVCTLVEQERANDAANGLKLAITLEGFIKRKVIKQTIMTTVYGVTRFGARLQIAKQLKDIDDFPKEYVWPASTYLVTKTFTSLREMFTSTREIQDWFTESARLISQICGQNVEYVTPLGLPVVQPYTRSKIVGFAKSSVHRVSDNAPFDMFERPNVMKQKNAFPPNFIHSLDSSHMMLTSLHCEQEGVMFVSVHDCFWTHPCTVPTMNKICREQFVALHSQPILEDLSKFLLMKYGYSEDSIIGDGKVVAMKERLNSVLATVPPKGEFDLNNVLESPYFFS